MDPASKTMNSSSPNVKGPDNLSFNMRNNPWSAYNLPSPYPYCCLKVKGAKLQGCYKPRGVLDIGDLDLGNTENKKDWDWYLTECNLEVSPTVSHDRICDYHHVHFRLALQSRRRESADQVLLDGFSTRILKEFGQRHIIPNLIIPKLIKEDQYLQTVSEHFYALRNEPFWLNDAVSNLFQYRDENLQSTPE